MLALIVAAVLATNGVISLPARAVVRAPVLHVSGAHRALDVAEFVAIGVRAHSRVDALELRVATDGVWGEWEHVERSAGPDLAADELATGSPEVSEPIWVGKADAWELRGPGAPDAEVLVVRAAGERITLGRPPGGSAAIAATSPNVHLRNEWGARAPKTNPSYASTVKMAFVHHTVDSNAYARGDVPAMLRAIQAYHMDANGWDDIAYNTLVDRFGEIWEGRGGGLERPVIGAHTSGFNTGSTGVAILGEFTEQLPSTAATTAVAEWLAWKLSLTSVDPAARPA